MRIIHTSDWHLGQHFMGKSRAAEHQAFIDWLLQMVEQNQVDAVIVAGDIFDTGAPPSYARQLYNQFVCAMNRSGAELYVLGGNHDSVATLHESRDLMAMLGASVTGAVSDDPNAQVLVMSRRDGSPGAVLGAIPYIRPRDLLVSKAGESGTDKQQALQQAIAQHYTVIFDRAEAVASNSVTNGEASLPVVMTGHLTTVGGQMSESVRDLYIGTLDAFPAAGFPAADYIALGHLHRMQQVGGTEHIRYSGSPIPLSFDEAKGSKYVLMVDFDDGALSAVTPLEVPRAQSMARISGSLKELAEQLKTLQIDSSAAVSVEPEQSDLFGCDVGEDEVADESLEEETAVTWLEVEVAEDDYLNDLQQRVEALIEGHPVELLRVKRKRQQRAAGIVRQQQETLSELTVEDVFSRRLAEEQLPDELMGGLQTMFRQVVTELEEQPLEESA